MMKDIHQATEHTYPRTNKVLLIYTGGTIGMGRNQKTGALEPLDFEHMVSNMPELVYLKTDIDTYQFAHPIDSSDVTPRIWAQLVRTIAERYDQYDGFVVVHGTDTMAYTASALSYMLENLTKPVILTGSQLPIGQLRTDGKENLLTSIELASAHYEDGRAIVPEVCIYFGGALLRGNRATKQSADGFDAFTTYNYPGANGIKMVNGGWDNDNQKEYIFKRINDWLEKYFGKNHGITLGITETDLNDSDPMVTALTYASFLGTMQDNGVEIFTPWTWGDGMYETVHLFSRYGHENRVQSTSSNDSLVSAYSSISNKGDSLTVIFVNRSQNATQDVNLTLGSFEAADGSVETLSLSGITGETFVSHTNNALKKGTAQVASKKVSLTLPAKSITAVLFTTNNPKVVDAIATTAVRPNYSLTLQGREILVSGIQQNSRYALANALGQVVSSGAWNGNSGAILKFKVPSAGRYILQIDNQSRTILVK